MNNNNLINDFILGKFVSSIVLHDFSVEHYDHKGLVNYCIRLMSQYGLTPTRMGIDSSSIKSEKMNTYAREVKKIDKIELDSITGISLQATIHASDDSHKDDIFSCTLVLDQTKHTSTFVLCMNNEVHFLSHIEINEIFKNLNEFFQAQYGYYYIREYKKGPRWYPFGVIVGLERGEKEREKISLWNTKFRTNNEYKTSDLRNIYPMNLIVQEHLNRQVLDNKTLKDFVSSDPRHGTLESLDKQRFAWWVEAENIAHVRELLRPSGIIIAG